VHDLKSNQSYTEKLLLQLDVDEQGLSCANIHRAEYPTKRQADPRAEASSHDDKLTSVSQTHTIHAMPPVTAIPQGGAGRAPTTIDKCTSLGNRCGRSKLTFWEVKMGGMMGGSM